MTGLYMPSPFYVGHSRPLGLASLGLLVAFSCHAQPAIEDVPDYANVAEQLSFSVRVETPLTEELSGLARLSFTPAFRLPESKIDYAQVQFASGGNTIRFRIRAGTREAEFYALDASTPTEFLMKTARFQTGTLAGTITIRAEVNAIQLNSRDVVVRSSVPILESAVLRTMRDGARVTRFEIAIKALSPTREVKRMKFLFNGARLEGATLFVLPVEATFSEWFNGGESVETGGIFLFRQEFLVISGPIEGLGGVDIYMENERGDSRPLNLALRF